MITPSFKLTQNNEFLFIEIKASYAKLNELDIFIDENDFRFYCKPYYLRLNLPGSILENNDNVEYNFEESLFKLKYQKKNLGEHFEGLELITKLLTPAGKNSAPVIEEVTENNQSSNNVKIENLNEEFQDEDEVEDDGSEWFIEQKVNIESELNLNLNPCKYGFAQTKSNVFSKLSEEYLLIVDLPDPDNNREVRTKLRIEDENQKFNDDHYLADYFDDSEMIETQILKYKTDYDNEYTETEIDILKNLPKRTYLLDKEQKFFAFSGLIDILFAYCYNQRINCGETNVESGWTIAKLSSTLSWFDTFKSLQDVLIASFRRSLCFPLYRNWKLTQMVFKDLIVLLKNGQKQIIKSLLDIRKSFLDKCDNRYILNDLYINDYIIWIQYINNKKLDSLISSIESIKITKEMVDFDLECLEMCAQSALENQNESDSNDSEDDSESTSSSSSSSDEEKDQDFKNEKSDLAFDFNSLRLEVKNDDKKLQNKPKIIELN